MLSGSTIANVCSKPDMCLSYQFVGDWHFRANRLNSRAIVIPTGQSYSHKSEKLNREALIATPLASLNKAARRM